LHAGIIGFKNGLVFPLSHAKNYYVVRILVNYFQYSEYKSSYIIIKQILFGHLNDKEIMYHCHYFVWMTEIAHFRILKINLFLP
jgi:hypothetical protein